MFFNKAICQPTDICVMESRLHGRGVFAKKNVSKGSMIEEAPIIFLSNEEKEQLLCSHLFNYYFVTNRTAFPAVFGFGKSSFYNHSPEANAFYTLSLKRKVIRFYAYRKIIADDEITINYNGSPDDHKPVYFPE
jgi:SET domain-containing protein